MPDEKNELKVTDRRIFDSNGQLKESADLPESGTSFSDTATDQFTASVRPNSKDQPVEMNFQTLVLSLGTTALVQLGLAPSPANGKTEKDLTGAQQTIDILGILQEKTKGNLSPEESRLLDQFLYDLKLSYVNLAKK